MTIAYIDVAKAPVETFPRQLFFGGRQGGDYRPWDRSTLFLDTTALTPVTADGQPVALVFDKSGNGNHLVQSVLAARPIYRTDGTLHWLEGDGVDDFMVSATGPVVPNMASLTIAGGFQMPIIPGTSNVNTFGLASPSPRIDTMGLRARPDGNYYFRARNTAVIRDMIYAFNRTVPHGLVMRMSDGVDLETHLNGVSVVKNSFTPAFAGFAACPIRLGDVSLPFRFYGGLVLMNKLAETEISALSKFYMSKVGLPI